MKTAAKPLLFALFIVAMLAVVILLPVREWLTLALIWTESHRYFAWVLFIGMYLVATVLVVPGTILTLAAGFAFGAPTGALLVSAGSLAGATAAFLVGRFFARDWVARRIARWRTFDALDKAAGNEGFVIVLLARLSPLFPFNLLNYAFGLTAVRLRDYVLASWIGMAPAIVLYVYIGSAAQSLTELADGEFEAGTAGAALFAAGLFATLALTIFITRKAARTLAQYLEEPAAGGRRRSGPHSRENWRILQ